MTRPRILIVEDEFLIRLTLCEALTDEGFDVAEASSGDEALALLEAGHGFALLLTDIQLPGKTNGLALVEVARRVSPDIPVIFMTGRPDSMAGVAQTGRTVFIRKPYLPSELCAAARALTGR